MVPMEHMMDEFTERMIDHAHNPRNLGSIADPHGVGRAGSDCGDWVQVALRLDERRRISECRFTAYGCGSAVASASVLTEMAHGKTIGEAARITTEDVITHLGGLPEHKTHCSQMSHSAFIAAVESAQQRDPVELA